MNKFVSTKHDIVRSGIIYYALLIILSSCSGRVENDADMLAVSHISGIIEDGANAFILVQKITPYGFDTLDSLYLDENSQFESEIPVEYPGFYAIRNSNGDYITFICKGGDSVKIYSDYLNFSRFRLEGTDENKSITELNNATRSFLDTIAQYAALIRDSSESPDYRSIKLESDRKYREAFENFKQYSEEFITRNEGSLVSLLALSNELGPGLFVFHPVKDKEIFQRTDSILMSKFAESEPVREIHEQLLKINYKPEQKESAPKAGEIAPEIIVQGTEGQVIRLSDLKHKIVLIDFWASWSQPSRDQNKELVKIYRKYKPDGFEILQLSLDRKKADWTGAIREDSLTWIHGSELLFWDSEIASRYGVTSLPSNFLVGKNGRIIVSNIKTPELDKILKDILTE